MTWRRQCGFFIEIPENILVFNREKDLNRSRALAPVDALMPTPLFCTTTEETAQ
ncbi:hypothetical protein [Melaminivora sp.]